MYFYRCTEQQLNDALQQIHESGDRLIHAVYKGGRDWVLICLKADVSADPTSTLGTSAGMQVFGEQIAEQTNVLNTISGRIRLIADVVNNSADDGRKRGEQ